MLTIFITVLFALYVLGPDLVCRWVIGFFAPARFRKRSYGEQITTACLLCLVPDILAWQATRRIFDVYSPENRLLLRHFADAVIAQSKFEDNADAFFAGFPFFWWMNLVCLVIVYVIVVGLGLWFGSSLRNLGSKLREYEYENKPRRKKFYDWLVRPWAAEWHLRLSEMLLPNKQTYIRVEVLTNLDVLYRGDLVEHHLAMDGALVSVTLKDPKKFRREELLADRAKDPKTQKDTEAYWSGVESNFFVIKADQITTLNVRYIENVKPKVPDLSPQDFDRLLQSFVQHLESSKRS